MITLAFGAGYINRGEWLHIISLEFIMKAFGLFLTVYFPVSQVSCIVLSSRLTALHPRSLSTRIKSDLHTRLSGIIDIEPEPSKCRVILKHGEDGTATSCLTVSISMNLVPQLPHQHQRRQAPEESKTTFPSFHST